MNFKIALITDAHIGTMLVDDHEARLDGGHDVTAFVLVVERGWIELRIESLELRIES